VSIRNEAINLRDWFWKESNCHYCIWSRSD